MFWSSNGECVTMSMMSMIDSSREIWKEANIRVAVLKKSSSSSIGATTLGGFWPALRFRSTVFYLYTSLSSFSLFIFFNPLNAELNPICHLLALLGVHFLHVRRIRVKSLTHDLSRSAACGRWPTESWVRIPPGAWIFVCCECRVLSGRGLCDELITRPEESYRLWCVVGCDLEI